MKRFEKWLHQGSWMVIICLGIYILVKGVSIAGGNGRLERAAARACLPALTYAGKEQKENWFTVLVGETIPLFAYWKECDACLEETESSLLVLETVQETESILEEEKKKETETEGGEQKAGTQEKSKQQDKGKNKKKDERTEKKKADAKTEGGKKEEKDTQEKPKREKAAEVDLEALQDFNYLLGNYYTVDMSTTADPAQIQADALLAPDMRMQGDASSPQILIYHTHSQEAFEDSVPGDVSTTIVGMGDYLTELLSETYGYNVIHNTSVFDMIDGQLDRNTAYNLAEAEIGQILAENPSIEVVIDLHRDGLEGEKMVTEINGKQTAKIMFFNGLSRTARNGEIDYLPNPYIAENLAFSFQLQLKAKEYYPDFTRNIYLQSLRYNLHMKPKSLLIEAGSQLNTVEEEKNAMEPLADILDMVLSGEG